MKILSNFGERLAELIFDNKLTPKQFAKAIELDVSIIYRYLRSESYPSLIHAINIANFFQVSLDYLFGLTESQVTISTQNIENFQKMFQKILCDKQCSRYRLRKDLGFAHQSLEDWYYGRKLPTMTNLIEIAKYFDCTLDYLSGRV